MTNPLWGTLEKAQDDATNIDEAVASAIAEHESDPTAHLGTGESLEQHKTEDVIDHPARSVFDDKFAYDRNVVDITFNNLDPFNTVHEVEINGINTLLMTSNTSLLTAFLSGSLGDMATASMFNYSLNPRMMTSFMVTEITSQIGYLIIGELDEGRGFGFKIVNSTLYALVFNSDYSEGLDILMTIEANVIYKLEAVVDSDEVAYFYVNNVLISTLDDTDFISPSDYILNVPVIQFKGTTASTRYLYVRGFHWESDIPT